MVFAQSLRKLPWITLFFLALTAIIVWSFAQNQLDTRHSPPDFRFVVQQGQAQLGTGEISFSSLLGQGKPVVLNFWAGLCPPCRAEMPGFQQVYDELGDRFLLVGVDVGSLISLGSEEDARRLLEELNITYPSATAVGDDPLEPYGLYSMPSTLFFSADGQLVNVHSGFLSETVLRRELAPLLSATSGGS